MQDNNATEFYERLVNGTGYSRKISLEHSSGDVLEGIEMSPVSKQALGSVIERLPSEMFEMVEEVESEEEAEELLDDAGFATGAIGEETVSAFEDLLKESLSHPDLTNTQMNKVVEHISFDKLFELGAEVIDISFEESGEIRDFREQ